MVKELEQNAERLISGTGVLRLNPQSGDTRYVRIYIDVIRFPKEPYLSNKYSPQRSRYATMSAMRQDYVIAEMTIDYAKRSFDFVHDLTGQNLIAVKCQYKGVLESFVNLGTALGLTVTQVEDKIKDYAFLDNSWDELQFRCEPGVALQVRAWTLQYDDDCESADKKKPPPPPPPLPPVPPGMPIGDISPPYPDDPTTSPDPLDSELFPPEPPDEGEECQSYRVTYNFINTSGTFIFRDVAIFGKYKETLTFTEVSPDTYEVRMPCQGAISFGCQPFGDYVIDTLAFLGSYSSYSDLVVTPAG